MVTVPVFPRFSLCVSAAAVASPLLLIPLLPDASRYDNQRVLELLCVLAAGLLWLSHALRARLPCPPISRPLALLLGGLFGLGLVSSVLGLSPRHALLEWGNLLLLLGAASLVAGEIRRGGDDALDKVLTACVVGCAAYLLGVAWLFAAALKAGGQSDATELVLGFDNYRFLNHVQTVSIPLLALFACRCRVEHRRLVWLVTAAWWSLLFLAAGRGTLLGLSAGCLAAGLLLRGRAWPWLRAFVLSGLAGLVVYLVVFALVPVAFGMQPFGMLFGTLERSIATPTSGRAELWALGLRMIEAHPWLGAGPMHFAHEAWAPQLPAHPHSWPIQFASEWGVPAMLLAAAGMVLSIWKLACRDVAGRLSDPRENATSTALLVACTAALTDGLVSGLLVIPTSQLWLVLLVGCAWGWGSSAFGKAPVSEGVLPWPSRIAVASAALAAVVFVAGGAWPDLFRLAALRADNLPANAKAVDAPLHPRFWHGGHF